MSSASDSMGKTPRRYWPYGYLFIENEYYHHPKLRKDKCEVCLDYGDFVSVQIGFHVFGIRKDRHEYGMAFFEDDPLKAASEALFFADVSYYEDSSNIDNAIDCSTQVLRSKFDVVAKPLVQFLHPLVLEWLIKNNPPRDKNGNFEPRWYLGFTPTRVASLEAKTHIEPKQMALGLLEMFL